MAQLPVLQERIYAWDDAASHGAVEEAHPETGQNLIKLRVSKPLPPIVNAEVGVIVNSLRSSLDLLAVAVAKRYEVLRADTMYFPLAESAAQFVRGGYKGHELIKALPADVRQRFEALQPYRGGNGDALVVLNDLDILRKHKRLITLRIVPSSAAAFGHGIGFPARWPDFEDGTVIAWTPIGAPKAEFQYAVEVEFDERTALHGIPVARAFNKLTESVEAVIEAFDW